MSSQTWSSNLPLQRLLALGMFACVAWTLAQMLSSIGVPATEAISTALLACAVFGMGIALGGRESGRHYRKYTDYSLVDWALLLVPIVLILKLLPRLLEGPATVGEEVASWTTEPWRFWDVGLVWSLLLVFFVWDYSVRVAEQLGTLSFQPPDQPEGPVLAGGLPPAEIEGVYAWSRPAAVPGAASVTAFKKWERSPYRFVSHTRAWQRLMWSFVSGGFVILVLAGLTLVSPEELGDPTRAEVGGVIPTVLVYYLLGLVLASQTSLDRLRADWLRAGAVVQPGLARRWLSYGGLLMLAACLVALLLPTSFAEQSADQAGGLAGLLWGVTLPIRWVLGAVFGVLGWVIAHIAAFLFAPIAGLLPKGSGQEATAPPPVPRPQEQGPVPTAGGMASQLVWGFLFYVVPGALALYAIWRTWQRRREIWLGAKTFFRDVWALIWGAVLDVVAMVWRVLGSASPGILNAAPAAIKARWRARKRAGSTDGQSGWLRLRGLTARQLILYFYVSLVQRAGLIGWGRRSGQTPYEYSRELAEKLPDRQEEVGALTEAFVRAKYSRRPVADEDARRARRPWERIRSELQTRRRANRLASWFGLGSGQGDGQARS